MAQRVFLILCPPADLERMAEAIVGSAEQRRDCAVSLAEAARPHMARVAASERVIAAAGEPGMPEWGYACNCMPYLLAATREADILASLDAVERLHEDAALEAFFADQAAALGHEVDPKAIEARRREHVAPSPKRVAAYVQEQLDQSADLYDKARRHLAPSNHEGLMARLKGLFGGNDQHDDPVADYVISSWIWIGQALARLAPCFWQGRNRWLGNVAFPGDFDIRTQVTTIGPDGAMTQGDDELASAWQAMRAATAASMASRELPEVRALLRPASAFAPELDLTGHAAEHLPLEGSGHMVSAGVHHDDLDALCQALRDADDPPYPTMEEWVEIVASAARYAQARGAHILEGDDVIYGAYRWPPIDG